MKSFNCLHQKTPNKRVKYAPYGRPTRKSEALLLAAYAQRSADLMADS
jgi:hypothetical protein